MRFDRRLDKVSTSMLQPRCQPASLPASVSLSRPVAGISRQRQAVKVRVSAHRAAMSDPAWKPFVHAF